MRICFWIAGMIHGRLLLLRLTRLSGAWWSIACLRRLSQWHQISFPSSKVQAVSHGMSLKDERKAGSSNFFIDWYSILLTFRPANSRLISSRRFSPPHFMQIITVRIALWRFVVKWIRCHHTIERFFGQRSKWYSSLKSNEMSCRQIGHFLIIGTILWINMKSFGVAFPHLMW